MLDFIMSFQYEPFSDTDSDSDIDTDTNKKEDSDIIPIAEIVKNMPVPFAISVASKRNTGKTVLSKHLIYELMKQKRINSLILLSNTADFNSDYDYIPKKYRHTFSNELLIKIIDGQKKAVLKLKKKTPQVLLLLDDVLGYSKDSSGSHSSIILSMYATARHYNLSIILLSQIANHVLSPPIKNNSDFILFSRLNRQQLAILWEAMTNIDKKDFIFLAESRNKDFKFLLYDNTTHETNPDKFIKMIKADPNINFNLAQPKK